MSGSLLKQLHWTFFHTKFPVLADKSMGSHQWLKEPWMHPLPQKWGIWDTEEIVRRGIQEWDQPGGDPVEGKEKQIKREGNKRHRNSKLETFWRIFFVLHICTCNRTSYLYFTGVVFLLPPQFGHFPIQATLLIIPRAEGVCQKLKLFPSLGAVGASNTWWNLEKAAEPQLRGLMFTQSPVSHAESSSTLAFFKAENCCKYLQFIKILYLPMTFWSLQPSVWKAKVHPTCFVYGEEGKCVSNTL